MNYFNILYTNDSKFKFFSESLFSCKTNKEEIFFYLRCFRNKVKIFNRNSLNKEIVNDNLEFKSCSFRLISSDINTYVHEVIDIKTNIREVINELSIPIENIDFTSHLNDVNNKIKKLSYIKEMSLKQLENLHLEFL